MTEILDDLFSSDFMPHGHCYLWKPEMVWLHAVSDSLIAIAYYLIPVTLIYFVRRRQDLPFHWVFFMFGLFIFGCGTTHLMEVWTIWHGTYGLSGMVKMITAGASLATAVALFPMIPKAVALPSPEALRLEIAERRRAEQALRQAKDELELRVEERTADLRKVNQELIAEIAERKQVEHNLLNTQAELAHISRVLTMGELTSSIAHEVNQPLAAMIMNGNACLHWLAADPPNLEEARDAARCIIGDGKRASEVIARIRALSRKAGTQKERLDINEAIHEVIALAQGELRKNRVALRTELAPDLPGVLGDRVQLQQVVLNLIINGVEAMSAVDDRPRELLIGTQFEESDKVRVTVRDSGVGLDPQITEHIFDAFFTTKRGGMGVGLSISRSIVENHGGMLWAVPNKGPGATFQFTVVSQGVMDLGEDIDDCGPGKGVPSGQAPHFGRR